METRERVQTVSINVRRAKLLIVADTHGQIDDRIAELSGKCDFATHAGDILAGRVCTHGGPSCLILTTQKTNWNVLPLQFERR